MSSPWNTWTRMVAFTELSSCFPQAKQRRSRINSLRRERKSPRTRKRRNRRSRNNEAPQPSSYSVHSFVRCEWRLPPDGCSAPGAARPGGNTRIYSSADPEVECLRHSTGTSYPARRFGDPGGHTGIDVRKHNPPVDQDKEVSARLSKRRPHCSRCAGSRYPALDPRGL